MTITRGTTPIFNVYIENDDGDLYLSEFAAEVTIKQGSTLIKRSYDAGDAGDHLRVALTQEETLSLAHTRPAYMQVRLKNTGEMVKASELVTVTVLPAATEAVMI